MNQFDVSFSFGSEGEHDSIDIRYYVVPFGSFRSNRSIEIFVWRFSKTSEEEVSHFEFDCFLDSRRTIIR